MSTTITDGIKDAVGRRCELVLPNEDAEKLIVKLASWRSSPWDSLAFLRKSEQERNHETAEYLPSLRTRLNERESDHSLYAVISNPVKHERKTMSSKYTAKKLGYSHYPERLAARGLAHSPRMPFIDGRGRKFSSMEDLRRANPGRTKEEEV